MPFVSGHGSARCNTIENSLGHLQEPPASAQSQRQITPTAVAPPRSKCASSHANPQKQAPCLQIPIDRNRCTSEPNAPALSSLGAFPTPANTPRHPRDRVASENLHISGHWSLRSGARHEAVNIALLEPVAQLLRRKRPVFPTLMGLWWACESWRDCGRSCPLILRGHLFWQTEENGNGGATRSRSSGVLWLRHWSRVPRSRRAICRHRLYADRNRQAEWH